MQSTGPPLRRRNRVPCPKCGRILDMARMRTHLREGHQLGSADVDTLLLRARREALRGGRPGRA